MDKKELWRRTLKRAMEDVLDLLKIVLIVMLTLASFIGFVILMYFLLNNYPIPTVIGSVIVVIIVSIIFKIQDAYHWEKLKMEREIEDKKKYVENTISYIIEDIHKSDR